VKNTLAVVQSITEQTFRAAADGPGVKTALLGRLQALARTHTLLTQAKWESVHLADLVKRATDHVAIGNAGRLDAGGPEVRLTPKASLALGLVLHELSTNAVKHGAWASDRGLVSVHWRIADGELVVEWNEEGVEGAGPASAPGFGSRLIRQAVHYDLGGHVADEYGASGSRCVVRTPVLTTVVLS
jgi:two-component sensor histidine kinase